MRTVLFAAFLLGACVPPSSTGATPTPSPALSAPVSLTPSPNATSSALPTSTFAVDPSAQWPLILYEGEGNIVRQRTESAITELTRPCGAMSKLEAGPAGLLAWCRGTSVDTADLRLISIPDGRVTQLASDTRVSWPADVSPDGRSVAAFRAGECVPGPPVCQTRAVLIDVASKTEREILPSGYPLGATLEWNALGLALFQPECAEAGCAGPEKSGTFVWDGSMFKKWSDLRFIARSGDWTLLERLNAFYVGPRAVIVRGPQGETTLSDGHALSIASNGETLVWRPGTPAEQRGTLLRLAPDGRVLWHAELVGTVLKMIGLDALLAVSPTNRIELYDLKRMLRFAPTTPIGHVVAGVAR
jgi:hypothetical protein